MLLRWGADRCCYCVPEATATELSRLDDRLSLQLQTTQMLHDHTPGSAPISGCRRHLVRCVQCGLRVAPRRLRDSPVGVRHFPSVDQCNETRNPAGRPVFTCGTRARSSSLSGQTCPWGESMCNPGFAPSLAVERRLSRPPLAVQMLTSSLSPR